MAAEEFVIRREVQEQASVPSIVGLASVRSGSLDGLRFVPIQVEVASRRGPAMFVLAGLAETSVRESRVRVTSALAGLGITLEEYALTVSLAPADVRKSGSGLDLAIAVSILVAIGHVEPSNLENAIFLGELALDGSLRPVRGVLPLLVGAQKEGFARAFVPSQNSAEASHATEIQSFSCATLADLIAHFHRKRPLPSIPPGKSSRPSASDAGLALIKGQKTAKRALAIAAAGHHNLLLFGPPGSGKSLLARQLRHLLPPLDQEEALEVTSLHSIVGLVDPSVGLIESPPFRAPHHSVSDAGLVGGGVLPRPGEVSLAHRGVLFLDELPEFRRSALESLRQPLEDGEVSVVRARHAVLFPARPIVIGAMNPCPCGHFKSTQTPCRCSPEVRKRYLARLSGPLLERIDLLVHVPPVPLAELGRDESPSGGEDVAMLVARARKRQAQRCRDGITRRASNSELALNDAQKVASLANDSHDFLLSASEKLHLSARSYLRVLRVARTIADLDDQDSVGMPHLVEALGYRRADQLNAEENRLR